MSSSELRKKNKVRNRRLMSVRRRVRGCTTKPRMCVVKSNKNLQVQLIDDETHRTLAAISTNSAQFRGTEFGKKNKASARKLGEHIAQVAQGLNITEVVFDRGRHTYHGVLAAVADAARESGLKF